MLASQPAWWYYLLIYPAMYSPIENLRSFPLAGLSSLIVLLIGVLNLAVKGTVSIGLVISLVILVPIVIAGSFGSVLFFLSDTNGRELFGETYGKTYNRKSDHTWKYFHTAYLSVAAGTGICWAFPPIGKSVIEIVQQFLPK